MSRRMESLLGQGGGEGEAPSEEHPDGSWRADSLARSRHARLTEHLRRPLDDPDPERAREICAEVCRDLLGDFAPALLLVPAAERFRCQVLAAWGRTLFDFAAQTGVEGERLAALNRLEFELEQALDGEPQGQPVFLGMAAEEARRPWPRPALDDLMRSARREIVEPRPENADSLERRSAHDARTLLLALVPQELGERGVTLVAAILRARALLGLGAAMRRDRAHLPIEELPGRDDLRQSIETPAVERGPVERGPVERGPVKGAPVEGGPVGGPRVEGSAVERPGLEQAVRSEIARIRPVLAERSATKDLPAPWRAAAAYARLAALALADRAAAAPQELLSAPPRLGLTRRLGLLFRARLGG